MTNRAIYTNMAIMGVDRLYAIGGLHDMDYPGSANFYMGEKL